MCTALCTIVAHNTAQNGADSIPSYRPDNHHCSDDIYSREGGSGVGNIHYTSAKIVHYLCAAGRISGFGIPVNRISYVINDACNISCRKILLHTSLIM